MVAGEYRSAGAGRRRSACTILKTRSWEKAIPYGVYDLQNNEGWVSVGIDHDTAEFAANSIRRWWQRMGRKRFSFAKELLITADSGGSNFGLARDCGRSPSRNLPIERD